MSSVTRLRRSRSHSLVADPRPAGEGGRCLRGLCAFQLPLEGALGLDHERFGVVLDALCEQPN